MQKCKNCSYHYVPTYYLLNCPNCGSNDSELITDLPKGNIETKVVDKTLSRWYEQTMEVIRKLPKKENE